MCFGSLLMRRRSKVIHELIARGARREFSRSMKFEDGNIPALAPDVGEKPRLMYIHVPFCEKLCPYCSFNRFAFDESLCREYFRALREELLIYCDKGYNFGGIYVGGGTPTILIDELAETVELANKSFSIREVSVETNPNHLTGDNLQVLKQMGVNRLSVGIQSFDDRLLKEMDRYDKYGSGEDITGRLKSALGVFDTLNADMIFNFPSQTPESLNSDLDILMKTGVDQITYYPLMVSDSTRRIVAQTLGDVDFRKEALYYRQIVRRLEKTYRFSSAWCFSKKTGMIDEYIVDYDEYAGLGSGSIGYLNGICYANTFDVRQYISQVDRQKGSLPLMAGRLFSPRDRARYDFLMKLFGMKLNVPDIQIKYEGGFFKYTWPLVIAFRIAGGLRYYPPDLYLTGKGRYMWVIMMREFFTAVNNFRDFCRSRIMAP